MDHRQQQSGSLNGTNKCKKLAPEFPDYNYTENDSENERQQSSDASERCNESNSLQDKSLNLLSLMSARFDFEPSTEGNDDIGIVRLGARLEAFGGGLDRHVDMAMDLNMDMNLDMAADDDAENDVDLELHSISSVSETGSMPISMSGKEKFCPTTPDRATHATMSIDGSERGSPMMFKSSSNSSTHPQQKMGNYFRIVYLSAFAIFGTTFRVYIGRFFGADCEFPNRVDDFFTPISSHICLTSNGTKLQHLRGAIFTDLPGNIIGCFVMGFLSSLHPDTRPKFPCLRPEHQPNEGFHQAITVGLCGCLTTFAAWNGQMILMLDGAATPSEFGAHIIAVILGYMLGLSTSVGSFLLGGKVFGFIDLCRNPTVLPAVESPPPMPSSEDVQDSWFLNRINAEVTPTAHTSQGKGRTNLVSGNRIRRKILNCCGSVFNWYTIPIYLVTMLLAMYLVADFAMGIHFYRTLWITSLLSPPGAFLRWKLSKYNKGISSSRRLLDWFPWGTFIANVGAAMLYVLIYAIQIRFLNYQEEEYPWTTALLNGIKTGFAGSLSTVSTVAKEIVYLMILYPGQVKSCAYTVATILVPMLLCICIFSTILWSDME